MTAVRQFVAVRFKPWERRTYTYHNDGAPIAIGEEVEVDTPKGRQRVEVVGLSDLTPSFPTKPIVGPAPPVEPSSTDRTSPGGVAARRGDPSDASSVSHLFMFEE
jgi:hypothetical protein